MIDRLKKCSRKPKQKPEKFGPILYEWRLTVFGQIQIVDETFLLFIKLETCIAFFFNHALSDWRLVKMTAVWKCLQVSFIISSVIWISESIVIDSSATTIKFPSNVDTGEIIDIGKREYRSLLERKNNKIYGGCWAEAILKLESSCAQLDQHRQSWLSILFTNCFLKTLGSDNWSESCSNVLEPEQVFSDSLVSKVKDCAKSFLHSNIFNTYSLFFVHTQSICFYLQSEQWQRHTENLVDHLVYSAKQVSTDLNDAVDKIRELEKLQNSSLEAQLSINEDLSEAKLNLQKFQEQTKEQRDLIEKVILQFELLREFLIREFSTNSAIVFYMFGTVVVYFVTTPQRTIGVRIVLYILLFTSFLIEKRATDYLINFDYWIRFSFISFLHEQNFYGDYSGNVWLIRKSFLLIMVATYFWWLFTYRDITQINYRLLNENTVLLRCIQQQLNASDKGKVFFQNVKMCLFPQK